MKKKLKIYLNTYKNKVVDNLLEVYIVMKKNIDIRSLKCIKYYHKIKEKKRIQKRFDNFLVIKAVVK